MNPFHCRFASFLLGLSLSPAVAASPADPLASGFADPPPDARIRAYWWWLNGQATPAAVTRDLEEMKAKGFGGALICDAGGAEQDGNDRVPHGPTFLSPEWRALYQHTLREADRLGLEMSLNIQSGWNLGGPMVTADDAAKKLVWSEVRVSGPGRVELQLPEPTRRDGYYRDLFAVAWRWTQGAPPLAPRAHLTTSSAQPSHPGELAIDGNGETFWVSTGTQPGEGPSAERPVWIQVEYATPFTAQQLQLRGRPGYGPREGQVQVSDTGRDFRPIRSFTAPAEGEIRVDLGTLKARWFRVKITGAHDPRFPQTPRNVQVAEMRLTGPDGAWPVSGPSRPPLQSWEQKAMHRALSFSAPDTTPLLVDRPATPGEEDTRSTEVLDLTAKVEGGVLRWQVPEGDWQVLRFGCTVGDHSRVSTCSDGWQGYALDVLDAGAFRRYWDAVVEPLIADAGALAGRTLKYLHTDSWEVEAVNWTPTLRAEFQRRRGYDFLPYLPVLAGRIVDSRPQSNRFLHDFRKTLGDLAIDNHYRLFRDGARRHGLQIHPESGGPHAVPVDAQRCLGFNDVPMSEFWAWSWRHRVGESNRFFVKQPASAAHTYGRRLVAAEGFTTIGPHWQETLWDNLKPSFDRACCEGLNLLVWHAFVCSPAELGRPGIQYFAGTHLNPNVTWWSRSAPFFAYLNRCQFLLQQGLPVADACFYYGDHVPNFAQLRSSDPARLGPGYDYDVITEEAVLTRLALQEGRWTLPDGMSYHVLVLPSRPAISLPVLRKLKELVVAGGTLLGQRPESATGLQDYPRADAEVAALTRELWGPTPSSETGERSIGRGRLFWGIPGRETLTRAGVPPDFASTGGDAHTALDFVHRRVDGTDLYFVANRSNRWERVQGIFRSVDRAPELWDPVTGEIRRARAYRQEGGSTRLPLSLAPFGSVFVVFRTPAAAAPATATDNAAQFTPVQTLEGPWEVRFDPRWGGPDSTRFDRLTSWTEHPEPGVRFYSGTATYRRTLTVASPRPPAPGALWLDLGQVRELAEVRLNGRSLGILWAPPFRVQLTGALRDGPNDLEIDVVNFWPNRIIGDAALPAAERRTRTNIRKLTADTPLVPSGLLGPVAVFASSDP